MSDLDPNPRAWFAHRVGGRRHLGIREPTPEGGELLLDAGPFAASADLAHGRLTAAALAERTRQARPIAGEPDWDVPVARPSKILCLGKNYAEHAREMGGEVPAEPLFFAKLPQALLAHRRPILLPAGVGRVDHEVELCCVVGCGDRGGHGARHVPADRALAFVAGYTILNDVTARELQARDRERGWPWLRAKSFDTFAPCGPFVVPAEAIGSPPDLHVELRVDGRLRQSARTSTMVVGVAEAIACLSRYTTLVPGDLIATGTPSGVGPLSPGCVVVARIETLGEQENPVLAEPGSPQRDRL